MTMDRKQQGSRECDSDHVMGDHVVHAMANGGDARNGTWCEIRQVSRARAESFRREAGSLHRGSAAATC